MTRQILYAAILISSSTYPALSSEFPPPIEAGDFVDGGVPAAEQVELGRLLFFDPVLSGNRNISCATCHHPTLGLGDALALSVGEGGVGLGPERTTGDEIGTPIVERVPRNAPPIFALGHQDATFLFHDGRVTRDELGEFVSPAGEDLPPGLENLVAVQAMFPVTSPTEMAGQAGENAIADAASAGDLPAVWALIAERIQSIPEYRVLMHQVFGIAGDEISYVHVANAIAAFEIDVWRSLNTNYDRFMRGDRSALSIAAFRGKGIFFRQGGCASCHSGPLFSDMQFHAIGVPQVGPGKGHGSSGHEDIGRADISGDDADLYAFRTPPLRNVAFTGPYMHDGAFATLEAAVAHHMNQIGSLQTYVCGLEGAGGQLIVPSRPDLNRIDCLSHNDPAARSAIAAEIANTSERKLSRRQFADLIAFLVEGLTDEDQITALADDLPPGCMVPSRLSVDGC